VSDERLTCNKCEKDASWSTPYIDEKGNTWCNKCAKEATDIHFIGIDQHLRDNKFIQLETNSIHYCLNNCVMVINLDRPGVQPLVSVWYSGGNRAYHVDENEKIMAIRNPFALLDRISWWVAQGYVWCTSCDEKIKKEDVGGYPLFAGVACKKCWIEHNEMLNDQKKKGQVCRRCGQPYGNCCC